MSYIVYGGVKYTQIRNAIFCKNCMDTIESESIHDLTYCSCATVGVDGGTLAGNRVLGSLKDMETRSMYRAIINNRSLWLPQSVIERNFNLPKSTYNITDT